MIRTVAPLVMSACASEYSVASLPRAFWMMKSEDLSPASCKDFFRYGASNSTYRVEEVVSGRITATLPLPREASGLSLAIAEKSSVNDDVESFGTLPAGSTA